MRLAGITAPRAGVRVVRPCGATHPARAVGPASPLYPDSPGTAQRLHRGAMYPSLPVFTYASETNSPFPMLSQMLVVP